MKVYTFSITRQEQGALQQIGFCVKAERPNRAHDACEVAILQVNSRPDYQREGYQLWAPRCCSVVSWEAGS